MYCKKWFVELNPIKTVYQLSRSQIAIQQRRQIFYLLSFSLFYLDFSHFFFYLTTSQQEILNKSFSYNLKLSYGLANWSDHFFFFR